MKNPILILLFLATSTIFSSCNTDDENPFLFADLLGTYIGAMNVQTPSFTNAQYTVTVTQLTSTSVKITPNGGAGTEWTATLTKVLGTYTCLSCVLNNQITFTDVNGSVQISYNFDDNNEQFAGVKQ